MLPQELPEKENVPIQEESIETFREEMPHAEIKYSKSIPTPRGSIVAPSYKYKSGEAIFLVEEKDVPMKLRDAAITENPSLIAGMKRYSYL